MSGATCSNPTRSHVIQQTIPAQFREYETHLINTEDLDTQDADGGSHVPLADRQTATRCMKYLTLADAIHFAAAHSSNNINGDAVRAKASKNAPANDKSHCRAYPVTAHMMHVTRDVF